MAQKQSKPDNNEPLQQAIQDFLDTVNVKDIQAEFQKYWEQNKKNLIHDFMTLLKFKSISTDPNYRQGLFNCFAFLKDYVQGLGFTKIFAIGKTINEDISSKSKDKLFTWLQNKFPREKENPVLVAVYQVADTAPWVLVYGHYDVQPADNEKWTTAPFDPVIKDDKVFARGASDDKGRFFANLIALKFLIDKKKLNANVALVIEGEEEIAGNTVKTAFEFIKQNYGTPTISYINDTTWFTNEIPSVMYSLRGAIAFELYIKTGATNLHSGLYGNIALNAGNLAGYVIYKLKDIIRNRLRIDRLHRLVRTPSNEEIEFLSSISPSWEQAQENSKTFYVTKYRRKSHEFLPLHMIGLRPSLDVNGVVSGYTQTGLKMIIPNEATIKFSIRTVPYMTSEKTKELVEKYITKLLKRFKRIQFNLKVLADAPYVWQDYNDKYMQITKYIMSELFERQAYFVPHGASNLAAGAVKDVFENTSLLMPAIGKPSHNIHAPNENIEIEMLEKGALMLSLVLQYI